MGFHFMAFDPIFMNHVIHGYAASATAYELWSFCSVHPFRMVGTGLLDLLPSIIGSVLTGFLIYFFIVLVFSARKNRAKVDKASGVLVLEYGGVLKAFPVMMGAFLAGMTIFITLQVVLQSNDDAVWMLVFVLAWSIPLAIFAIEVYGVKFELSPDGIRKRSPWSNGFFAVWSEVESVTFSGLWEWYIVQTSKGKMRLSVVLDGLDDFLDVLRQHASQPGFAFGRP